jgi:hypothetical protein
LPEHFFSQPLGEGAYKLDHARFGELVADYHRLRSGDP